MKDDFHDSGGELTRARPERVGPPPREGWGALSEGETIQPSDEWWQHAPDEAGRGWRFAATTAGDKYSHVTHAPHYRRLSPWRTPEPAALEVELPSPRYPELGAGYRLLAPGTPIAADDEWTDGGRCWSPTYSQGDIYTSGHYAKGLVYRRGVEPMPAEGGIKPDAGKPRTDLLPPRAVLAVARVLGWGAAKRGDDNWRTVVRAERRYVGAALRHVLAWLMGERIDSETQQPHLACAATSLLFSLDLEEGGPRTSGEA